METDWCYKLFCTLYHLLALIHYLNDTVITLHFIFYLIREYWMWIQSDKNNFFQYLRKHPLIFK